MDDAAQKLNEQLGKTALMTGAQLMLQHIDESQKQPKAKCPFTPQREMITKLWGANGATSPTPFCPSHTQIGLPSNHCPADVQSPRYRMGHEQKTRLAYIRRKLPQTNGNAAINQKRKARRISNLS